MKAIGPLIIAVLFLSCNKDEEPVVPNYLEFQQIDEISGAFLTQATGFFGSSEENALYISFRDLNPDTQFQGERVSKLDLESFEMTTSYFDQTDFITKQVHITDDRLMVVGGQFINLYNKSLSSSPISIQHGLTITRFGTAIYNNDLYLWGGDLNQLFSDIIYRWNDKTESFEFAGALPKATTWAHGEVVGDRIYIFGGQEEFQNTPTSDQLLIFDLTDTLTASLDLPQQMFRTFTSVQGDFIYVAGQLENDIDENDLDFTLGVFDTEKLKYSEIQTNLSDDGTFTISQIAAVGKRLYDLYGERFEATSQGIFVANLP